VNVADHFVILRERFRLKNNLLPVGKIGFASPAGNFAELTMQATSPKEQGSSA
jgi:hypothetical protein